MQLLYPLIFLLFWIAAPAAVGQEASPTGKAVPIHIEADRMESHENRNEVIFLGRVEAVQGDLMIQADEMTVFYLSSGAETPGVRGQRIEKMFARGGVKVNKGEWVGTGHVLDYFAEERRAVLTGDARVWQDNNLVTGNRVTLYLDEGRTIVERSGKEGERVRAFIYPEPDGQTGQ